MSFLVRTEFKISKAGRRGKRKKGTLLSAVLKTKNIFKITEVNFNFSIFYIHEIRKFLETQVLL